MEKQDEEESYFFIAEFVYSLNFLLCTCNDFFIKKKKTSSKSVFSLSEAMTDSIQQRNYVNQVPSSIAYPHTHIALCIVLHSVCM